MKISDRVVIACDWFLPDLKRAEGIRGALEAFFLDVHLTQLKDLDKLKAFLGGDRPEAPFLILSTAGGPHSGPPATHFKLLLPDENQEFHEKNWELTPGNAAVFLRGKGETLINLGCCTGHPDLATAVHRCGFEHYVAPTGGISYWSQITFSINFFHYLMYEQRDAHASTFDIPRATMRAAAIDEPSEPDGTQLFRCFSRNDSHNP